MKNSDVRLGNSVLNVDRLGFEEEGMEIICAKDCSRIRKIFLSIINDYKAWNKISAHAILHFSSATWSQLVQLNLCKLITIKMGTKLEIWDAKTYLEPL
jgi:hypothetical protein